MSEQSIIYVVKIGVDYLDDVVFKVGKASENTLKQRVWSAHRSVSANGNVKQSFTSITVNGNGRFHEIAMQVAFSKTLAPIKTTELVKTEYYTPYVNHYNYGVRRCEYTDEGIEHALSILKEVHLGAPSLFGVYLASVISPSTFATGSHKYSPAYCTRNKDGITVTLGGDIENYDPPFYVREITSTNQLNKRSNP